MLFSVAHDRTVPGPFLHETACDGRTCGIVAARTGRCRTVGRRTGGECGAADMHDMIGSVSRSVLIERPMLEPSRTTQHRTVGPCCTTARMPWASDVTSIVSPLPWSSGASSAGTSFQISRVCAAGSPERCHHTGSAGRAVAGRRSRNEKDPARHRRPGFEAGLARRRHPWRTWSWFWPDHDPARRHTPAGSRTVRVRCWPGAAFLAAEQDPHAAAPAAGPAVPGGRANPVRNLWLARQAPASRERPRQSRRTRPGTS